jgi:hypothetical protein
LYVPSGEQSCQWSVVVREAPAGSPSKCVVRTHPSPLPELPLVDVVPEDVPDDVLADVPPAPDEVPDDEEDDELPELDVDEEPLPPPSVLLGVPTPVSLPTHPIATTNAPTTDTSQAAFIETPYGRAHGMEQQCAPKETLPGRVGARGNALAPAGEGLAVLSRDTVPRHGAPAGGRRDHA